jgi:F-type H+-transporting ATPase subunit b
MATPATTGADAAHKAGFPPFQAETFTGQLIWFAIAFGLLYWLMSKIALPKVGAVLHDRAQRIATDLDEADAMRTKAQEAEQAYETSLAQARDKAKGIAQEMRDRLGGESDARRKELEAELATKLAEAEATISARTQEAMASVRGIAAEAAGAIVERLTGRPPESAAIEAHLDRHVPR